MIFTRLAPLVAFFLLCIGSANAPLLAQDGRQVEQGSSPTVYEVESLDNGTGQEPPRLFLDTPMGLIESFMVAGEREDWDRATAALDYANIARSEAQVDREELAAQLYHLMSHTVAIDWAALPDRPDAMDVTASSKNPMAGVSRRSLTIALLELGDRRVPIRLARVQEPGGEPVWVFSRQTVANVPALYAEYGPTEFEKMLPAPLREQAAWTLAWWELIALPLVLIVAAVAGLLTYLAIRRLRERYDADTKIGGVLQAIHLPVTLLAFAGTFALVRNTVLRLSGPAKDLLDPFQLILIIAAILGMALAAIEALFEFATSRRTDELEAPGNHEDRNFYTKMSAIRRIVTALLLLAAVGFLLVASNIADTLGFSILASAGVLGLVLAFAARKVLGDIMASVQIAFAQTARIGDAVQFEGQWCFVEKIGFTHLRLRTWDERRVIAPVSTFTGESFENWTKQDASLMTHVELQLDNRADVDALREEFGNYVQQDDDIVDPEDAVCEVVAQDARAKTVRFMARAADPKTGWSMHCRVREHMLAFAARLDATIEPTPVYFAREREVSLEAK
ncbi:mechanosensitive ion channel family protein [Alteriqipengyuania lutimaris]|uniref:Mechanosensitive ion channel protein MscS n=1 Tax=Alteriqipengyuania lutimaris TaxID=1538146 RepID=A0A395LQ12_9SPHN|nr:mechanosensitive ion channel domain-containing protein [Alteriqipengyuania lutimaris]MBB3033309.1 small-conductance mechanosensitive channel [Alteriqipengyuania lutimaris]RDS77654.1 mechanosensitive ion channel protein MscS [Alteriqipengyuania lutimaris]